MKRIALSLAAIGVLGIAVNRACAAGPLSHAATTQVTARYGAQHAGYPGARYYGQGYPGFSTYPGYRRGYGPALVHPRMRHRPAVVIPFRGHRPVIHPPIHRRRPYDYWPDRGFSYSGPGFSIGIRF